MATWYPHAVRKPIDRNHGGLRRSTRAIVNHVDAGGADSLYGWFNNPKAGASSHFYVKYNGVVEQYMDADLIAWTQRDGNATCIGIETQGKGEGAWTQAQFNALVALNRWLCERYGIPKQSMGDSRPSSRGIGYHRMGISPWRVAGGQVWGPNGKVCPGNLRVDQFPALVAAVKGSGAAPTTPTGPGALNQEDDMLLIRDNVSGAVILVIGGVGSAVLGPDYAAYQKAGIPVAGVSAAGYAIAVNRYMNR